MDAQRTRLVFVRHGASRAHEDGVVGGPDGCKGLTAVGRAQAEALRDRVIVTDELAPDVVLTSVLPRAIETAEIVSEAFVPGIRTVSDCDYCELHPGVCDGLTWDEFRARYGSMDDPDVEMSPGGESLRTFDARVRRATASLIETYAGQSVVMFTHGGFISAACCYLLGAPGIADRDARSFRLEPSNTSITAFSSIVGGRWWTLERYNDVAHVASLMLPS
jgi:2,3-bisphosphoglycerate-dependent phosphoglycerate mutase